jgi:flagellar motor switch protein FliG
MAEPEDDSLTPHQRAAALLLMLDEREASEVLRHLPANQIHAVANAMAGLPDLRPQQIRTMVTAFYEELSRSSSLTGDVDAQRHIRKLLVLALGKDKAEEVISRLSWLDKVEGGLETLARRDPKDIADMVREEHPQATATLLAYQEARLAADVISLLDTELQEDIITRMATLENVSVNALEELNEIVRESLGSDDLGNTSSDVGGPKVAAGVLASLDASVQSRIIEGIREADEALGETIEKLMFTFEDVLEIDDRSIQTLLGEISSQALCTALKGTDDEAKEKFFRNMSKRAAEMLKEDLETRGPVALSEVEAAQREVIETARKMIDDGRIITSGVGGEQVVY